MARNKNSIVYLSTFPPRECGIATFTQDLCEAMDKRFNPAVKSKIAAINESPSSFYNYPKKVFTSLTASNLANYVDLAKEINGADDIKIVDVQHEFGLFDGTWGDFLIPFLQVVQKPVVITLHSVISDPDEQLKRTVSLMAGHSKAFIVMNERSKGTLEAEYGLAKSKIFLIPHGIPQTTFEYSKEIKAELGLEGRTVLSTFGMLSRDKGVEYAIRALPDVIKKYPDVIYLVIGATHPVVRRQEGESYRNFLQREVEKLHLGEHVKFYNKYLPLEEIIRYLKATDVYLSTVVNPKQSVSGTLSYALGCGRAVVSTATEYAQHILNERNGRLINFKDPDALAFVLKELLSDEKELRNMHRAAYASTRHMTWPNVAAAYFRLYNKFADLETEENKLPEIKLDHLKRLTDDFGIFQHATYSKPEKRFGYSLDDVARALIVCAKHYRLHMGEDTLELMRIYLDFMEFAQRANGRFANIISFQRTRGSEKEDDVQGRAIWALGYVISQDGLPAEIGNKAKRLFHKGLRPISEMHSPRAIAFTMNGLYFYLTRFSRVRLQAMFQALANQQVKFYKKYSSPEWQWFEDELTYSNSKLSEPLFYAYHLTKNKTYLDVAEKTLQFLSGITFGKDHYSPIGQAGWYHREKQRSYFDQQPEDAASMVETKVVAYKITKQKHHLDDAYNAFQWFLGKNHLQQMVYDEVTGGCHDGVGQNTLNLNQGAESTISYLLARLALEDEEVNKEYKKL